MNDLPFTPFNPETPLQPEAPPAKPKRQSRKKKPTRPMVTQGPEPAQPASRQRRVAKAKPAKRAPKFDLQTAMQIGAELSDLGEQTVFLKLFEELSALPKKACKRIVGALAVAILHD